MNDLSRTHWNDIAEQPIVLLPLGSVEQHGPHLPLYTDTAIAVAVANGVAGRMSGNSYVAPALFYGSSGEHQSFPGTVSIGRDALKVMLVELVRSLSHWASRIVVINAHGGNVQALAAAVKQMRYEGHNVAWAACATENVDAHAGYTETSLMLHLDPGSVDLSRAEAGNTAPIGELLSQIIAGGVAAVSPNGVLGDPGGATAEEGARVLECMITEIAQRVDAGEPDSKGFLTLPDRSWV
ncbi:mycofactocin biosynthesis peptidyl-dipeptidase MftE [Hoyosella altamirensis]|uniref:Creatinine amidohydrolase n=1 Tax=Hoyosella altamirensis TaxID=616997 RepID=A0A839RQ42_9ACTN|nr:mycofactocin biosynthesis peptidyl-dipeptidase MftE [Hoyosella altamirensis]MBB3038338.1 creatinine amidohydrolase [Hoyosella altamirensis]